MVIEVMEINDIWKRDYKEMGDLRIPKFRRAEKALVPVAVMEKEQSVWQEEIKIVLSLGVRE